MGLAKPVALWYNGVHENSGGTADRQALISGKEAAAG